MPSTRMARDKRAANRLLPEWGRLPYWKRTSSDRFLVFPRRSQAPDSRFDHCFQRPHRPIPAILMSTVLPMAVSIRRLRRVDLVVDGVSIELHDNVPCPQPCLRWAGELSSIGEDFHSSKRRIFRSGLPRSGEGRCMRAPNQGRMKRPLSRMLSKTRWTMFDGIEKPMPWLWARMELLMLITSPLRLMSGPPEFAGIDRGVGLCKYSFATSDP